MKWHIYKWQYIPHTYANTNVIKSNPTTTKWGAWEKLKCSIRLSFDEGNTQKKMVAKSHIQIQA